jgi:CDP-diglyceride synthetase
VTGRTDQSPLPSLRRGRNRVRLALALLLGIELVLSLSYSPRVGSLVLTLLLCWALWRGYRWSRGVTVALTLLGALLASGLAFHALRRQANTQGLFQVSVVILCIAVAWLLWSGDVSGFMAAQRSRAADTDTAAT